MQSNYRFFWLISFILISTLLAGCDSSNSKDTGANDETDRVSVSGLIRTSERITIEGVEAYNNDGVLATSDANGAISFTVSPEKASSVRLRKTGYAAQTVVLEVNNNTAAFLATLGKRSAAVTLNADAAIDITGNTGAMVSIAAGALVDANGSPVSGEVQLNMTPVDVSDENELGVFPGAFAGTDIDGNAAPVIMSYGTVEYHFTQNGEKLNLAPGQSATIEIPVFVTKHPDGSLIQLGEEGALWSLDETTGQWLQEDTGIVVASIQSPTGMALRATVTHFSWWNHDIAPAICDLTITSSGLPQGATGALTGRTGSPAFSGRRATTNISSSGITVIVPRDTDISFSATASTADGAYSAIATNNCNNVSGTLVLDYEGPEPAKIIFFTGTNKPIFKKGTDGLWFMEGNDGIFIWEVISRENLTLSSDQGHNTTLGSIAGATQFPLDLSGSHVSSYTFTLTATTSAGSDTQSVTITYNETPEPIVNSWAVYRGEITTNVYWKTEGADTVSIGYVENEGDPQFATLLVADINAEQLSGIIDSTSIPEGSDIVLIFTNQYGSTYEQFTFSECPAFSDFGCTPPV